MRTWWIVYSVFFQDALVYKANALIWMMTDTVPAVVMPLMWLASYHGRAAINGFSPSQMVLYYIVVLFLTCLVESHVMWDMESDIRQGKFNVYLTRPFSFMSYMYASNLSWRLMRTLMFVPLFALVVLLFHHWVRLDLGAYNFGIGLWLAVILGHIISFGISYSLGLLGLIFVQVRSIYNFYYLPLIMFNGQLAPISFFPGFIRTAVSYMPFYYTLGFPAQVFLGHIAGRALVLGIEAQIAWIVIAFSLALVLWHIGLRKYTAYGI